MKVGLVDVDGNHRGKKKWGAMAFPNLALGKIARWHRERGDDVEWAFAFDTYDRVYVSKVFNFTPDDRTIWQAKEVIRGGTGYDVHSMLPEEIDRLQPDYSFFPFIDRRTAYGFLTRGCPNRCKWCVVPRKEGALRPYMDVDEIAIEGRDRLVLMDNNILAAGEYAKEQLEKIIDRGYMVDFNQALDARLVDEDFARLLSKVKWIDRRMRFGCDTHKQIDDCERAVDMLLSNGFKGDLMFYTMLHGNMAECYERISHWWLRNMKSRSEHEGIGYYVNAQPFRDTERVNTPPQWQKDMAGWCNKRMVYVACDFKEFAPRKGFRCESYFSQESRVKGL